MDNGRILEKAEGTVEHITYQNAINGFTVADVSVPGDSIVAVGLMPDITEGDSVIFTGYFEYNSSYGTRFKVEAYERLMPSGAAAVLRYLSSGNIKGIGPATARNIVQRFGGEALTIIEEDPIRLVEIKGISKEKALDISKQLKEQFGAREVITFMSNFRVSPAESLKIYKYFGPKSMELIKSNPFLLCGEGIGFSFDRADNISLKLGLDNQSFDRISAGILYVLRHNLSNGHTCIPTDKLIAATANLVDCDSKRIEDALFELKSSGGVKTLTKDKEYVFLPELFGAERYISGRLKLILQIAERKGNIAERDIEDIESALSITFADAQRKAIITAVNEGFLILTGGPGTGKTTTLKGIINVLDSFGCKVALAAPTGRAAKRMTELTGYEAKTIHRLLEVEWGADGKHTFQRNEKNLLDCDTLIVDEVSMVDTLLFESLLRAMPLGCRLILVGDSDQLPSVGAGNILFDMIDSGVLPSIELKEVFRQSLESLIVTNAHKIVRGEDIITGDKNADMFVISVLNPVSAARNVVELCSERLPKAFGFSPKEDIQVLCPSKMLDLGTVNLNNLLQKKLNPECQGIPQIQFKGHILRQGDKVMQIKNNYDIIWTRSDGESGCGVYNGDVGIIESIDIRAGVINVRFDDKVATYMGEEVNQLELSYAVTVHKSQGSEFDCVILPILDAPQKLCYRNILYTAVTRAKKLLVIVGSREKLKAMINNNRRTLRYTMLGEFLREDNNGFSS